MRTIKKQKILKKSKKYKNKTYTSKKNVKSLFFFTELYYFLNKDYNSRINIKFDNSKYIKKLKNKKQVIECKKKDTIK